MTETAANIMGVSEIAKFSGLTEETIREEIKRGKLKAFKKSGVWMASVTNVVAWFTNYKDKRGRPKKEERR